jgi:hypothetical protein
MHHFKLKKNRTIILNRKWEQMVLLHVGIFNKYSFSFIYRSSANIWTFCQQYVLALPTNVHVLEDADWPDLLITHTHTHTHALVFTLVHTHLWSTCLLTGGAWDVSCCELFQAEVKMYHWVVRKPHKITLFEAYEWREMLNVSLTVQN